MVATMTKPTFGAWETITDRAITSARRNKNGHPANRAFLTHDYLQQEGMVLGTFKKTLAEVAAKPTDEDRLAMQRFYADRVWHVDGRPYFKVWPDMVLALANTSLDIDASLFKWPYSVFSVMLPDCSLADKVGKVVLVSFLDREATLSNDEPLAQKSIDGIKLLETSSGKELLLQMGVLFFQPADEPDMASMMSGVILKGQTIQQAVDWSTAPAEGSRKNNAKVLEPQDTQQLFSLIFAIALFAAERHELVCPDVEQPVIDRDCRPALLKMREEKAEKIYAQEVKKCRGWLVGSSFTMK